MVEAFPGVITSTDLNVAPLQSEETLIISDLWRAVLSIVLINRACGLESNADSHNCQINHLDSLI